MAAVSINGIRRDGEGEESVVWFFSSHTTSLRAFNHPSAAERTPIYRSAHSTKGGGGVYPS